MKAPAAVALGIVLLQPYAHGEDGSGPASPARVSPDAGARQAGERSLPGVNLIAFIGRKIETRYVERKPKDNELIMDAEFFLRYEVLQVVFGSYPHKQMTFTSYVHIGKPEFEKHKFGLVYVSEHEGRLYQQKYLFQAVYPTADGRWAGCGDPYAGMPDVHRHGVRPDAIVFRPPVVFDTKRLSRAQIEQRYPSPLFSHKPGVATCVMGNYPAELFRVMKEGYLMSRGVFPLAPPRSPEPSNQPMKPVPPP